MEYPNITKLEIESTDGGPNALANLEEYARSRFINDITGKWMAKDQNEYIESIRMNTGKGYSYICFEMKKPEKNPEDKNNE